MSRPTAPRGVTLVELAIVIAVAGILAAVASPAMLRWRYNYSLQSAASEFAATCGLAKNLAIGEQRDYRVRLVEADAQFSEGDFVNNAGRWVVEGWNDGLGTPGWDVLPLEVTEGGTDAALPDAGAGSRQEGDYDLFYGQAATKGISIIDDGDLESITFTSRGFVDPLTLTESGCHEVVWFINKWVYPDTDCIKVCVDTGGNAKMSHQDCPDVSAPD